MKGLAMEDASSMGYEIQRLKRSVRTAQILTLLLGLLVLALLIALAAVGASQAKKLNNLKNDGDDVYFGIRSDLRDRLVPPTLVACSVEVASGLPGPSFLVNGLCLDPRHTPLCLLLLCRFRKFCNRLSLAFFFMIFLIAWQSSMLV